MDKKQALLERNNLSRLLGTQTEDDGLAMNIFLLESLNRQKDIFDAVTKACELIKARQEETLALKDIRYEICALIEALEKSQKAFSKELKVIVGNFPEQISEVKISNPEDLSHDHPKEIRVSNLKEIKLEKFPEQISLKKPTWYRDFDFQKLSTLFKQSSAGFFTQAKTAIFKIFVKNAKPQEAIPVRLVTEDGEKFYRAGNVFVGGGSKPGDDVKFSPLTILFANKNTIDTDWHDSASIDFNGFRTFCLFFNLAYTGNPTNIRLQAQFSPNNSNWYDFSSSHWDFYKESKASVTTDGISKSMSEQLGGRYFRLRYKAAGVDAVNYFTLTAGVMANK